MHSGDIQLESLFYINISDILLQILVWHTKTVEATSLNYSNIFNIKGKDYNETNLPILYNNVLATT